MLTPCEEEEEKEEEEKFIPSSSISIIRDK